MLSTNGPFIPITLPLGLANIRGKQPIDFDGDVNLFHFVLLRCVGKGAFGKVRCSLACYLCSIFNSTITVTSQVRVVQHKQTRELYALKYINKTKCVKMKAVANIVQERRLLEEVRSLSPHAVFHLKAYSASRLTTHSS